MVSSVIISAYFCLYCNQVYTDNEHYQTTCFRLTWFCYKFTQPAHQALLGNKLTKTSHLVFHQLKSTLVSKCISFIRRVTDSLRKSMRDNKFKDLVEKS